MPSNLFVNLIGDVISTLRNILVIACRCSGPRGLDNRPAVTMMFHKVEIMFPMRFTKRLLGTPIRGEYLRNIKVGFAAIH